MSTRIICKRGDITKEAKIDAIVNAANSSLLGGGGVDGSIHKAGGPKILEECKEIRANQGGCKTGEAVITTGGNLNARFVIHTVGPVWRGGGEGEAELLRVCYVNSLKLAVENGLRSVAFPSISTGAYGYPVKLAVLIAVGSVQQFIAQDTCLEEVRFVLFSRPDQLAYHTLLNR